MSNTTGKVKLKYLDTLKLLCAKIKKILINP